MAKKIRFKIITFEKLVKIMVWIGIIFLVVGITASFPLAHWMKKENYPNYFNDNETMETAIFYSNFLYYYSDKDTPENNVGWFTNLAVSKVYTNADTVDSENTQKYLNKIGENLNNID